MAQAYKSVLILFFCNRRARILVLNRVRKSLNPVTDSIGRALSSSGLPPDFWTVVGFLFALIAGVLYALRPSMPYLAALAIIASGIMDVLDGAAARAMNRVSKTGSFNDSTLDRLAEVAIYAGIVYANYTSPVIVLLTLGFSLLVSYTRAKGDALSVTLSGIGIGERAERLIVLVVFSILGFVAYGVYVVLVLAFVTFIQRYVFIYRKLRSSI